MMLFAMLVIVSAVFIYALLFSQSWDEKTILDTAFLLCLPLAIITGLYLPDSLLHKTFLLLSFTFLLTSLFIGTMQFMGLFIPSPKDTDE
ncbi:hypothetical protein [Candidatus Albibeggiatoa sp. nov. NOAA]|uniref:hypothetical protein n=1 Tax=Candidatus Albibeggiatoa sp. nov. NOAA TaxID=3162724 RepID=UPI0033050E85|nr:hypothetical protein [Thiotrichaceae bacterium]